MPAFGFLGRGRAASGGGPNAAESFHYRERRTTERKEPSRLNNLVRSEANAGDGISQK